MSELEKETASRNLSRRRFLALTGQGVIAMSVLPEMLSACGWKKRTEPVLPTFSRDHAQTLDVEEWNLIEATQNHLLPSSIESPGPGASEANATGYLDAALQAKDVEKSEILLIKNGVLALDELSVKNSGRRFVSLSGDEREKVLREFEDSDEGYQWLSLVMKYTLEAYLGDPAYGGNPEGIVWQWLEHQPGFPRPPLIALTK